jgi:hypothetical protein
MNAVVPPRKGRLFVSDLLDFFGAVAFEHERRHANLVAVGDPFEEEIPGLCDCHGAEGRYACGMAGFAAAFEGKGITV